MIALDVETAGLLPGEMREDSLRARVAFDATLRADGSGDPRAADSYLALSLPLACVASIALTNGGHEVVNLNGRLVDLPDDATSCGIALSRSPRESDVSLRVHDDEAALLEAVQQQLAMLARCAPLVTFNGARFDLPLLFARMIAHQIKPPRLLLDALRQKPWESGAHVDLMSLFGHGNTRGVGPLRAWAIGLLGLDPKADGDGAHVGELIWRRDGVALARYNLGDVRIAAALYQRWMEVMPLKNCVRCGHKVGRGGDRHAVDNCPPPKGSNGWRRRAKAKQRAKRKREAAIIPARGEAVSGIHKKRGSASK